MKRLLTVVVLTLFAIGFGATGWAVESAQKSGPLSKVEPVPAQEAEVSEIAQAADATADAVSEEENVLEGLEDIVGEEIDDEASLDENLLDPMDPLAQDNPADSVDLD